MNDSSIQEMTVPEILDHLQERCIALVVGARFVDEQGDHHTARQYFAVTGDPAVCLGYGQYLMTNSADYMEASVMGSAEAEDTLGTEDSEIV